MRNLYVVNASDLLRDNEVEATVQPLQTQLDRDFIPLWRGRLTEPSIKVMFAKADEIPSLPADCWPIFLNRHSNEPDALGWHDDDPSQNIRTYSRVFVGDCLHLDLDWHTTLSHEALELVLDPDVKRVFRMHDGRFAAYEACDAVEADNQAYAIGSAFMASNFVLPSYFSLSALAPYDFRRRLRGRCPTLTTGGYMSVTDRHGDWTQVTMDQHGGLMGRRASMHGYRRQARSRLPANQLIEMEPTT